MAQRWLLPLLAALALPFVALAQQPEQVGDSERGRELAENLCSGCHLVSPQQQGPVNDAVPSFMTMAKEADQTYMKLIAMFEPGHSEHPAMPSPPLDRQQMRDVVAYIAGLESGQ